ncbi:MAG TPA: hypothetical protein VFN41_05765 [Candidatus Limnocylindrales bacterium]|nr:hypothetical protein [Candidatus Limnocylindrales bacterium]
MRLTDRSTAASPGRAWIRLYPRAWRERYEDELLDVLGFRPLTVTTRLDLIRGALDAHVHPLTPPRPPTAAALFAGMAWIVAGLASSLQPLMPDWPGFLLETIPLGVVGAVASGRSVAQVARRSGLSGPRGTTAALLVALIGNAVWIIALVVAALGGPYGAITGATGAIAAIGIVLVGAVRSRAVDRPAAECLLIVGAAMLIPSPAAWVLAGGAWIGLAVTGLRLVVPLRRA